MSGLLNGATGAGVLAAGLVDILENIFDTVYGLIILAIILVGVVFVIMTWTRTRSLVPTLGALLLGALVVWGASSFDWLADRINEDVEDRFQDEDQGTDIGDGGPDSSPIDRPDDGSLDRPGDNGGSGGG